MSETFQYPRTDGFNAIYADDTVIMATSRHSKVAAKLTQTHLAKIEKFFWTWGLKINPRKTQAIAFTRTHQKLQHKITVSRTEVEWSGQIEYLRMILDKRLTFSDHTESIRSNQTQDSKRRKARKYWKTSSTQKDTQMPPASSRKKDTGGRRTDEGGPGSQRS
ncbi:hypothetical protein Trydic_g11752 [Trypoxylus dichotomus]